MATYGIWRDVVIGSDYGAITWGTSALARVKPTLAARAMQDGPA